MSGQIPGGTTLARLRAAGLRPTRQRLVLAQLLFANGDRHVTAEQLHAEASAAQPRVSLATVYNTLHQFVEARLLQQVIVEPGRSYFDTNTADHHHFFCEPAGFLQDIPACALTVRGIPQPPAGTAVERVEVVIRVQLRDS